MQTLAYVCTVGTMHPHCGINSSYCISSGFSDLLDMINDTLVIIGNDNVISVHHFDLMYVVELDLR